MDGTVLPSHFAYALPILKCCQIIIEELGICAPDIHIIIKEAETIRKNLQAYDRTTLGKLSNDYFEHSWVLYYRELCNRFDQTKHVWIERKLYDTAHNYILEAYELFPGVIETLEQIKINKILCTMGNEEIQGFKIKSAGLDKLVDHVEIVPDKIKETYINLAKKYNLLPEETIMIGDNMKLDILPTLDCGWEAYHVLGLHQEPYYLWHEFPAYLEKRYTSIHSFNEILAYI